MQNKESGRGLLLVFIASLLFSIGGLAVKSIPWQALSINSFRSILSVMVLLIFAKLTRHKLKLTPGVLAGAVAVCSCTLLYTVANKLTTAANTILLQFTAPAFVILFMWLCFRQRPKRRDIIACLCVFGGIACFFLDGLNSGNMLGNFFAVLSGVGYAWVFMLNKLPGGDPLFSTILGHGAGAIIGFPSLLGETQFGGSILFWAILLGVFQMGLAYACLTTGIRTAPPISASLATGIEPILNPILVAVSIGESLSPLSLAGGVIVFGSVMVYNLLSARDEQPEGGG